MSTARLGKTAAIILTAMLVSAHRSASAAETGPFRITVESGVKVPMRDGVVLVADIYRPVAEGPFPVLLQRTPYDRRQPRAGATLASHGYVVVLQDTRGRYSSDGEFYPFRYEAQDGYDTVEWAAALPHSNGRVGMFGGSYVGATQMLAAVAKPPHLVAIQPYVTASDYYEGWTYQGGALMEWFTSSWASRLAVNTLDKKSASPEADAGWLEGAPVTDHRLLSLPSLADLAPYYRDWLAHPTFDDYWRAIRVSDHYGEISVKGLHQTGWHDIFVRGAIENYIGLRKGAATAAAREGQRLVVGPWAHWETSPEGKVGDVVFGRQAVVDSIDELLDWSAETLKDERPDAGRAPVRIFVMGDNVWRDEREFPLARARATRYYLHSGGSANGAAGDGRLSTDAPRKEPADRFEYDPAHPVPTLGGRLCCGPAHLPGPADQRPNETRPDVLVYSTPPLTRDLEVTGFITAELSAATSATDTDFTALLVDVDEAGYARYLADGIVRARYRRSRERAEPVEPGKVEKYEVDLWATSNVFKTGHRLRLYVSSSNFPRFSRNANGAPDGSAVKASQTIYHDTLHPSALVLPVVPRR
jgi:uncharacterized protein